MRRFLIPFTTTLNRDPFSTSAIKPGCDIFVWDLPMSHQGSLCCGHHGTVSLLTPGPCQWVCSRSTREHRAGYGMKTGTLFASRKPRLPTWGGGQRARATRGRNSQGFPL